MKIEIKFTEADKALLFLAILFGLVFGILGNIFSTLLFRVIDNYGGLYKEFETVLFGIYLIAVFGFVGYIFLKLKSYKIIISNKKKSIKRKIEKDKI